MYKINATLKSPLMIGGKTLNNNYRKSKNYIPGSVLRAAYAKAIIQRCNYEQKNYWLDYKAQEPCKNCEFQTICKNFSKISFPTLYPMDSSPYPITAREKKYKDKNEKSILDILKSRLIIQKKLKNESAWKRLEGLYKNETTINLIYSTITRTAIDYQRNTAKEGSLYTQNVISEKYLDSNKNMVDVSFSGDISLSQKEEQELSKIQILHIGADITKGLGICHITYQKLEKEDTSEQIEKRIQEFNSGIKGEKQFVILDLLTDAYLELEEIGTNILSQTEFSDQQMLDFLEQKINLPKNYQLWKAFKFQEILRGFDTSKNTEKEMRRNGHLVVKAGAVFVYQVLSKDINGKELLKLENTGIGKHLTHGFGKIRICDNFHIKYDVLRGENKNE